MACRPVFVPRCHGSVLVKTEWVEFEWFAGMSIGQKQKSIGSLHGAARSCLGMDNLLEVSSKSGLALGNALSAFNLMITTRTGSRSFPVECAYQASKVFEQGGPYLDLLDETPLAAKRDSRLRDSGRLVGFRSNGRDWALEPKTVFYDWLYINALRCQPALSGQLSGFDAFTDIEFNPKKSINCQAYSVALYRALMARGLLDALLSSPADFVDTITRYQASNSAEDQSIQPGLGL